MRGITLVLFVATSFGWATPSKSKDAVVDSTFVLLDTCSDSAEVYGLGINSLYCLSQNILIAEGVWVDSEGHGLKLVAIERATNRLIFDGLEDDAGGNAWTFYRLRAQGKLIVLGVIGTEWSSREYCLVFDTLRTMCSMAGEFQLEVYHQPQSEADNMFPADQIKIQQSDTVVIFRFPRKVIFRPYQEYTIEDSVVYTLDLRTDSLSITYPLK